MFTRSIAFQIYADIYTVLRYRSSELGLISDLTCECFVHRAHRAEATLCCCNCVPVLDAVPLTLTTRARMERLC
jgi:hypothetical protein